MSKSGSIALRQLPKHRAVSRPPGEIRTENRPRFLPGLNPVRSAWLQSTGTEETFEITFPEFADHARSSRDRPRTTDLVVQDGRTSPGHKATLLQPSHRCRAAPGSVMLSAEKPARRWSLPFGKTACAGSRTLACPAKGPTEVAAGPPVRSPRCFHARISIPAWPGASPRGMRPGRAAHLRHRDTVPTIYSFRPWLASGTEIFRQRCDRQCQNDDGQHADEAHGPGHQTVRRPRGPPAPFSTAPLIGTWDRPDSATLIPFEFGAGCRRDGVSGICRGRRRHQRQQE